jgi:hypothetical protein
MEGRKNEEKMMGVKEFATYALGLVRSRSEQYPWLGLDRVVDSNWCAYLFEYFDRADAKLAGCPFSFA